MKKARQTLSIVYFTRDDNTKIPDGLFKRV